MVVDPVVQWATRRQLSTRAETPGGVPHRDLPPTIPVQQTSEQTSTQKIKPHKHDRNFIGTFQSTARPLQRGQDVQSALTTVMAMVAFVRQIPVVWARS
jgi:hypothetical protein